MDNYKMAEDSLPPNKICSENIDGVNVNEASLYKVENEKRSNQGRILKSYNVKTITKVENEAISDWLKATDEENFSERNSVLDSEELDSGISSMSSGYESSDSGEERREMVVKKDKGVQVCEILK